MRICKNNIKVSSCDEKKIKYDASVKTHKTNSGVNLVNLKGFDTTVYVLYRNMCPTGYTTILLKLHLVVA